MLTDMGTSERTRATSSSVDNRHLSPPCRAHWSIEKLKSAANPTQRKPDIVRVSTASYRRCQEIVLTAIHGAGRSTAQS